MEIFRNLVYVFHEHRENNTTVHRARKWNMILEYKNIFNILQIIWTYLHAHTYHTIAPIYGNLADYWLVYSRKFQYKDMIVFCM